MVARLRAWWQYIRKHWIVAIIIGCIVVIAFIFVGYWFDWTGFNGYNKVTKAHTISGPNAGATIQTEEYQPGKALWDWLQLLIIPAVLAVGGYLFNYTTSKTERAIALDNQREAALKDYLDKMSELLLHEKLRESKPESEVRKIARVQTLTVLPRLDANRKRSVLLFLYESGLINEDNCIIDLKKAADLEGASLKGANLELANLFGAILRGANLEEANLRSVLVEDEELEEAKSLKGATMPDGTIHP